MGDVFDVACSPNGVFAITSGRILIYGNPDVDPIVLFSDKPSTLIVIQDGKCTEKTYKTVTRQTFAETSDLSDEDCKHIKNKVAYIVEQESKYLDVLVNHVDEATPEDKKNPSSPLQTSYKSASETARRGMNSLNRQVQSSDSKKGGTSTQQFSGASNEPQKTNDNPLGLYSQFQEASKSVHDNLEAVAVSHQQTGHNGVTVTEQVSSPTGNAPGAMPQPVAKDAAPLGHPVYEAAPLAQPAAETADPEADHGTIQLSGSKHSYLSRLSSKYSQVKSQVSGHVHKPSSNGWDFTPLNKLVHSSHL